MAKNTGKARDPIKWVRDRAKSAYVKADCCAICGTSEDLEFHHYNSLTELFEKWARINSLPITTDDEVVAIRDRFISEHHEELYEKAVTLCNKHHMALHKLYGIKPPLSTAAKQERWVKIQAEKHELKKLAN